MPMFNSNAPQYHTCCCGAHITKLSRVLIVITLVFYLPNLYFLNNHGIAGLLIAVLGMCAVFQEHRAALLMYIGMMIVHAILVIGLINLLDDPFSSKREKIFVPLIISAYIIAVLILIPILKTYWKLAQFIKDRETAQLLPVHYK